MRLPFRRGSPGPRTARNGNNEFALDLYARLAAGPGNVFFSPLSVRVALALGWLGARGRTAEEMKQVLRLPDSPEALATELQLLRSPGRPDGTAHELAVANSIWTQEGETLLPDYVEAATHLNPESMQQVDFRGDPEGGREAINLWVSRETHDRIEDLIPPDFITSLTRLIVANAVYFKGRWEEPFEASRTQSELFHLEGEGNVRVPMMYQAESHGYGTGKGFQAVDLECRGGLASMLVLLPDEKDGLRDLESMLFSRGFDSFLPQMTSYPIKLFLPRYKITYGTVDLVAALQALGMSLAFSDMEADFSGINGIRRPNQEAYALEAVLHKAYVEVNEVGAEAAAATAGTWLVTGLPPREPRVFRADHPFLFAIRERSSGTILFLGRVMDPTQETN